MATLTIGRPPRPPAGATARALPVAGGGWSPFYLGGALLGLWDAEQPDSLTGNGTTVDSWRDLVAGYAVTQPTAASKPLYATTAFNGRPSLTFDGTDDFLELGSMPFPSGASSLEIWALVSQDLPAATTGTRYAVSMGGDNGTNRRGHARRSDFDGTNRATLSTGGTDTYDASVDFSGIHLVRSVCTTTQQTVYVDGNSGTMGAITPNVATTRTRIGGSAGAAAGNFWGGKINFVAFTNLLSADQAVILTSYLKTRSGIT